MEKRHPLEAQCVYYIQANMAAVQLLHTAEWGAGLLYTAEEGGWFS